MIPIYLQGPLFGIRRSYGAAFRCRSDLGASNVWSAFQSIQNENIESVGNQGDPKIEEYLISATEQRSCMVSFQEKS